MPYLVEFIIILSVIALLGIVSCAIYLLYFRKKYAIKIPLLLIIMYFFGLYILYCELSPIMVTNYCIEKQCISIVKIEKNPGVNSVSYLRIYNKIIVSRFQLEINDYVDFLIPMDEMGIYFVDKLIDNKLVIKSNSQIKINGYLDNIELFYINYSNNNNDISLYDLLEHEHLKFRQMY